MTTRCASLGQRELEPEPEPNLPRMPKDLILAIIVFVIMAVWTIAAHLPL
jgi:hypothetical protein